MAQLKILVYKVAHLVHQQGEGQEDWFRDTQAPFTQSESDLRAAQRLDLLRDSIVNRGQ